MAFEIGLPAWTLVVRAFAVILAGATARFLFKFYSIRRKFQLMQREGLVSFTDFAFCRYSLARYL